MKRIIMVLGVLVTLSITGCKKIDFPQPQVIELGTQSTSTAIKSITQQGNVVTAEFETTIGAKYSVQIIPFGSEVPSKREGFTANQSVTTKVYDLSELSKKDYDLVFIDISGKEVKYPIVIK
jgi:hypothetical protein